MTDIATCWTECRATWNKGASGVIEQVQSVEEALPFDLLGFDSDNGSEFLNWHLVSYFSEKRARPVYFTRSRAYHKNDNAHVEQKNWSFPRQMFGYERLGHFELVKLMNELYSNEISLLRNHFSPCFKLKERKLIKSRHRRVYEKPQTPYQRVMESKSIPENKKQELALVHATLDPILLQATIRKKIKAIFSELKRLNQEKLGEKRIPKKYSIHMGEKVFEGIGESEQAKKQVAELPLACHL